MLRYLPADVAGLHLQKMPLEVGIDIDSMASRTEGFSGADLSALAREAGLRAMSRNAERVCKVDLEGAMADTRPSITKEMMEFYERFKAGKAR